MCINFLMNYYLYTNFGKILEKNFKKLYNFNKNLEKTLKKII